jgi:hypothetical protein
MIVIIDRVSIDTKWHSSILGARFFRAIDCDTDHFRVRVKIEVFR